MGANRRHSRHYLDRRSKVLGQSHRQHLSPRQQKTHLLATSYWLNVINNCAGNKDQRKIPRVEDFLTLARAKPTCNGNYRTGNQQAIFLKTHNGRVPTTRCALTGRSSKQIASVKSHPVLGSTRYLIRHRHEDYLAPVNRQKRPVAPPISSRGRYYPLSYNTTRTTCAGVRTRSLRPEPRPRRKFGTFCVLVIERAMTRLFVCRGDSELKVIPTRTLNARSRTNPTSRTTPASTALNDFFILHLSRWRTVVRYLECGSTRRSVCHRRCFDFSRWKYIG